MEDQLSSKYEYRSKSKRATKMTVAEIWLRLLSTMMYIYNTIINIYYPIDITICYSQTTETAIYFLFTKLITLSITDFRERWTWKLPPEVVFTIHIYNDESSALTLNWFSKILRTGSKFIKPFSILAKPGSKF